MAQSNVSMKLLVADSNGNGKRVLFAEAGKDCVDFLFHILSLPVATIIRLLRTQGMAGSLPNLYKSLENLDPNYMQSDQNKDTFLKPVAPVSSSWVPLLALNEDIRYMCCRCGCPHVSDSPRAICIPCFRQMSPSAASVPPPAARVAAEDGSGLVKGVVTYMVMDDLEVKPMSTISTIALLNKFNAKDVGALEEKVVNLGMEEALELLKASLQSKNVLTDVFC